MDPSKNYFFGQFLGLSAFFLLFSYDFWFILVPSGGIFLTCLVAQIFSCFFIDFSQKIKNVKKEKVRFHLQITVFGEGRHVGKSMRIAWKNQRN